MTIPGVDFAGLRTAGAFAALRDMKTSCWILGTVAALLLTGCPDQGFPEKRKPAGSPAMQKSGTPAAVKTPAGDPKSTATGPFAEYGKNLSNAEKTAAQTSGLVTLNQSVKQFEVVEGRLPRSLDELVASRYLDKLPPPPRGKRFIYDLKAGKVDVESLPESTEVGPEAAPTPAPAAAPAAAPAPEVAPVPLPELPAAPAPAPAAP